MLTLAKGKEINGRYVIHEVVGAGGFATVWKASDKQLNRDVALKRLLKDGTHSPEQELKTLLAEAQKHAQLVHTNIVQVYDVIECEGEHLIVMEYVEGTSLHSSLRALARRGETYPLDVGVGLLGDILEGVAFAHERKTVHRDLSPSNILVRAGGIPKIADFGIARVVASTGTPPKTITNSASGTGNPEFMSPEQARGEPADFMSDLFMVGILGYLLLSGRHPFAHPSGLFTIPELLKDDTYLPEPLRPPPGLSTSQHRLFREYSAIVMRLLERPKAGRFTSAQEALEAIDAVTPTLDCPACGERVPEHNRFCGQCGTALDHPIPESGMPAAPESEDLETADELVERGYRESVGRRWEAAISLYKQALSKEPRHKKAHRNLGFALNRVGRYEEAERVLTAALDLLPREPQHTASLLVERSLARSSRKQYDAALSDINDVLGISPRSVKALYERARLFLFMGRMDDAQSDAVSLLRLVPDHAGGLRLIDRLRSAASVS